MEEGGEMVVAEQDTELPGSDLRVKLMEAAGQAPADM